MQVPGLPPSLPAPSVLPKGSRVLLHAVAIEHAGELRPCGGVGEDGQVRTEGGIFTVDEVAGDDFDPRSKGTELTTKLPHADVWLVVAVGPGERLHGEYATPNARVGDIVTLAGTGKNKVRPRTSPLTGPMQGIIHDHDIECCLPESPFGESTDLQATIADVGIGMATNWMTRNGAETLGG